MSIEFRRVDGILYWYRTLACGARMLYREVADRRPWLDPYWEHLGDWQETA